METICKTPKRHKIKSKELNKGDELKNDMLITWKVVKRYE